MTPDDRVGPAAASPDNADAAPFVVGGAGRLLVALALAGAAGGLLAVGRRLELGLAWSLWVPALALLLVGLGLAKRSRLRRAPGAIDIETGWLFRRVWRLGLAGCAVELLPTAGLYAVVLHRGGREVALATWLGRRRAEALLAWLDRANGGELPRHQRARPAGDR